MQSATMQTSGMARKRSGQAVSEKNPFAEELGRRVEESWRRAGYSSRADFARECKQDYQQLSKWIRGEVTPSVESLAEIARTCGVSLDWLVFGALETPPAYADWLDTPTGRGATEEAKRYLRSLPLAGFRASRAFYDLAHQAFSLGLAPDDAVTAARKTASLRSRD